MKMNQDADLCVQIKNLRDDWLYSVSFGKLAVTLPGSKMRSWVKERGLKDESLLLLDSRPLPPIGIMEPIEYIEQDCEKYVFLDLEIVEVEGKI